MRMHKRRDDERDRAGSGRNHRRTAAGKGDDDADDEGGKQADLRIDAGDEGKGNDLGDQGEGGDSAGEHFAHGIGGPLAAVGRQV